MIISNKQTQERAIAKIKALNLKADSAYRLTIEDYSKRSTKINALYWIWMTFISKECDGVEDKKAYHKHFKQMYLDAGISHAFGIQTVSQESTVDLNNKEFSIYMSKIEHFMWQFQQMTLPHPDDLYKKAMMEYAIEQYG